MPVTTRCDGLPPVRAARRMRRADSSSAARRALLACVLAGVVAAVAGCRVLRSRQTSDENMAAARQLSLQGIDAQQRNQWDRAEMLFAAAILKCPSDERARCGYAESLWQRGERAAAISSMEEAVRLSGDDPERLVRLGMMYLTLGDIARAKTHAERAIAANAQLSGAWALRGKTLQAAGDQGAALASYHRALSLEPAQPEVQLAVADIYSAQDRPQRALATLQSLADRFPTNQAPPDVLFREGLALRALGRPHEAIRSFTQAAQKGPPAAELLLELARTQLAVGDHSGARNSLALALGRDPAHAGCVALARELGPPQTGVVTASAVSTAGR